jgi:hypothetical protein
MLANEVSAMNIEETAHELDPEQDIGTYDPGDLDADGIPDDLDVGDLEDLLEHAPDEPEAYPVPEEED